MIRSSLIPAFAFLAAASVMPATPAHAQTTVSGGICPGATEMGVEPKVRVMKVVGAGPRVNFIADRDAKTKPTCPDLSEACKRRGFVVPGDDVLVGEVLNGMACVTYIAPNAKKVKGQFVETNGFLPASALAAVPAAAPKPADWLGQWSRSAEAEIEIRQGQGGKLDIKGNATFGALDPGRVKRGAVNMGELDGQAAPQGNRLFFGDGYNGQKLPEDGGECQARLHLHGRYLVVEDSGGCGGMNVRFTGIYVRLQP